MSLPVLRTARPASRWDPMREFDDLSDRMSRLMASVFGPIGTETAIAWTPLADVIEAEDAYLVEIELPGVERDDISVEVIGNELVVTGEFKERERAGMLRNRTRRVGRFDFRAVLPRDVNSEEVSAELSEGVLTIRVPKSEAVRPRQITVKTR